MSESNTSPDKHAPASKEAWDAGFDALGLGSNKKVAQTPEPNTRSTPQPDPSQSRPSTEQTPPSAREEPSEKYIPEGDWAITRGVKKLAHNLAWDFWAGAGKMVGALGSAGLRYGGKGLVMAGEAIAATAEDPSLIGKGVGKAWDNVVVDTSKYVAHSLTTTHGAKRFGSFLGQSVLDAGATVGGLVTDLGYFGLHYVSHLGDKTAEDAKTGTFPKHDNFMEFTERFKNKLNFVDPPKQSIEDEHGEEVPNPFLAQERVLYYGAEFATECAVMYYTGGLAGLALRGTGAAVVSAFEGTEIATHTVALARKLSRVKDVAEVAEKTTKLSEKAQNLATAAKVGEEIAEKSGKLASAADEAAKLANAASASGEAASAASTAGGTTSTASTAGGLSDASREALTTLSKEGNIATRRFKKSAKLAKKTLKEAGKETPNEKKLGKLCEKLEKQQSKFESKVAKKEQLIADKISGEKGQNLVDLGEVRLRAKAAGQTVQEFRGGLNPAHLNEYVAANITNPSAVRKFLSEKLSFLKTPAQKYEQAKNVMEMLKASGITSGKPFARAERALTKATKSLERKLEGINALGKHMGVSKITPDSALTFTKDMTKEMGKLEYIAQEAGKGFRARNVFHTFEGQLAVGMDGIIGAWTTASHLRESKEQDGGEKHGAQELTRNKGIKDAKAEVDARKAALEERYFPKKGNLTTEQHKASGATPHRDGDDPSTQDAFNNRAPDNKVYIPADTPPDNSGGSSAPTQPSPLVRSLKGTGY